eukprot:GHVT01004843.1.p1 GENE.GHVT01004843.1~~GHVT01004843.1.p1  ORF type:complete len:175 (+),score=2.39 GHVT01004843.1:89-613(+)
MDRTLILVGIVLCTCGYVLGAGRYKACSEGCCVHEYCVHGQICYPKSKCSFGCPDGSCITGNCVPQKLCKSSYECGMGLVCTLNHNLGFNTCQYDLNIGSTLCDRRRDASDHYDAFASDVQDVDRADLDNDIENYLKQEVKRSAAARAMPNDLRAYYNMRKIDRSADHDSDENY